MTEATTRHGAPATPVTVRPYRPTDHGDCRSLWAQLVERHRELYADPTIGGADPGAGFEEYLTRLDLGGIWVAEQAANGVIGLVGLVLDPPAARVDPLIVRAGRRGEGAGSALLGFVAAEGRRRGLIHLTVTPAARDVEAIRWYHAAGYTTMASVTLTRDLAARGHEWRDGLDLHELRFRY